MTNINKEPEFSPTWKKIREKFDQKFLDEKFASVSFRAEDVIDYVHKELNRLPTNEEVSSFMSYASGQLEDDMVGRGWDSIETLVGLWKDETFCSFCGKTRNNDGSKIYERCKRCQDILWTNFDKVTRSNALRLIEQWTQWISIEELTYKVSASDFALTSDKSELYAGDLYDNIESTVRSNYIICKSKDCDQQTLVHIPKTSNVYDVLLAHIISTGHGTLDELLDSGKVCGFCEKKIIDEAPIPLTNGKYCHSECIHKYRDDIENGLKY